MKAANNQGNRSLPSAAPASEVAEDAAAPLKLQLEVTLPRELGGELKAWRRAFERFAEVMERWLESSLAHPGLPAPPPPSIVAPVPQPQPAHLPSPPVAPNAAAPLPPPPPASPQSPLGTESLRDSEYTRGTSTPPPQPILPDEMPPLLIEDLPPAPAAMPRRAAEPEKIAAQQKAEARPAPPPSKTVATAAAEASTAGVQALLQAQQGDLYRTQGRKEKALACYHQALILDPTCAQAYLGQASIYIEQGHLKAALHDCNTALRQQPRRAVLYVLRGLVYVRMGNLKRALDEAEDALRFDPRLPSAYMLRGSVRFKKGMMADAVSDVKHAIRLRPKDAKFRAELARLLAETEQYEQAARNYAKALELAPNFHEARLLRGAALRLAGEAADAEAELTEYLRRCPRSAAAHYQRGLCRLAQRNYVQAMTDFDKAIGLDPNGKAAYEAKQKTLEQWEGTARQARSGGGSAGTVALAATASAAPPSPPPRAESVPAKPTPPKTRPVKPKPKPNRWRSRRWDDDEDKPRQWLRPAKWVCIVALVGLLGFGGFHLLADVTSDPYKPDDIPPVSATLSADELFQRFHSNPATAKTELSEKFVEVQGLVDRHFDAKEPPLVLLAVTRSKATVNCALKAKPSLYQQMMLGQMDGVCQASIVGQCAGTQGSSVVLNECLIVNVAKGRAGIPRGKH